MTDRGYSDREERGLSARQLVMLFLGIVTVCGVFFAAGFLVGYNERTSKELPSAEHVTPSSDIPPTVNPPAKPEERPASKETFETAQKAPPTEPTPLVSEPIRKRPEPKEVARAARPASPPEELGGRYVLQVAASSSRQDAEEVAKALKSKGFPAFVFSPQQAATGDKLYRVQIGPYSTREAAEQVKPRLEREGFKNPFIKH